MSELAPPPAAIIFDYGGVLTVDRVSLAILGGYERLLGWAPGTLASRLLSGPTWEAATRGELTVAEYWQRVGQELEPHLPPAFARFRDGPFTSEPMNPAMVALVHELQPHYRLALCSNALITLRAELEAQPALLAAFAAVVISAEVGLRKPDPRIYELTAQRLGVPLGACLLIDDKPRNTSVAQALGMKAITFVSAEQTRAELGRLGVCLAEVKWR
jgi:putative hydrolase of the HAD superfamily